MKSKQRHCGRSIRKFFEKVNDSVKSNKNASPDDDTVKAPWELGAFAIEVPQYLFGLDVNNTRYARLIEAIVRANDLGVILGAYQSIEFKGILVCGSQP